MVNISSYIRGSSLISFPEFIFLIVSFDYTRLIFLFIFIHFFSSLPLHPFLFIRLSRHLLKHQNLFRSSSFLLLQSSRFQILDINENYIISKFIHIASPLFCQYNFFPIHFILSDYSFPYSSPLFESHSTTSPFLCFSVSLFWLSADNFMQWLTIKKEDCGCVWRHRGSRS